jgi:uncharacterized protein YjbJ (UPF0337 family)
MAMDRDRISGSVKDMVGKVESAAGDLTGDAKAQAAGRAREAAGTAQDLYGQAKDVARQATDAATSYAKDAYNSDTFRDATQALTEKVQKNPLQSLLVAGIAGFALALFMMRAPRR